MVKITGGQRIDLLGMKKEDLPGSGGIWACPRARLYQGVSHLQDLRRDGFLPLRRRRQHALASQIERRFQGIEFPHKMKLATAGCPRNCSEATTKDIGAVAIEGGRWEIYVGGAAGSKVRKGDLLCTVDTHDEVAAGHGPLHAVLPGARASTSSGRYDFVERIGIEALRRILIDDSEGICARARRGHPDRRGRLRGPLAGSRRSHSSRLSS